MFAKAALLAQEAMFPIFCFTDIGGGQKNVGVNGAGFFVSANGHFVSVAHLFADSTPTTAFKYWGQVPDHVLNPPKVITEIARDDEHDIFIGKIDVTPARFFTLSGDPPMICRSVCISGFPLAVISNNNSGGLELGGVRRYFQPSFILDRIKTTSQENGIIRTREGFLTRDAGLFGMSGGPVFDVNGVVMGVQSAVTSPRESVNASGRKIIIENAIVVESPLILKLARKHNVPVNERQSYGPSSPTKRRASRPSRASSKP